MHRNYYILLKNVDPRMNKEGSFRFHKIECAYILNEGYFPYEITIETGKINWRKGNREEINEKTET